MHLGGEFAGRGQDQRPDGIIDERSLEGGDDRVALIRHDRTVDDRLARLDQLLPLLKKGDAARGRKVFFVPDQHLGRNTGKKMGIPLDEMVLWNPFEPYGGLTDEQIRNAKIILWQGHCK